VPAAFLLLTVIAGLSPAVAAVLSAFAALAFFAGTLAERWLFFAEARHAVMNYYGS